MITKIPRTIDAAPAPPKLVPPQSIAIPTKISIIAQIVVGIAAAVSIPTHDELIRTQIKIPRMISKTLRPIAAPNSTFGVIFSSDIQGIIYIT